MASIAVDGDTIVVPPGTATWTNELTVTKGLTILGAGIDRTVIINAQNDIDQAIFRMAPDSDQAIRISGFTFNGQRAGRGVSLLAGTIQLTQVRVDNNKFVECDSRAIVVYGWIYGVVDHNEFVDCYKCVDVYGGSSDMNRAWTRPVSLGSEKAVYIESNVMRYTGAITSGGVTSGGQGARYVFRYNTVTNSLLTMSLDALDAHGNQAQVTNNYGTHRGTVSYEIYGNNIYSQAGYRHIHIRGGTGVIFDNVTAGSNVEHFCYLTEEDGPARFEFVTTYPGYDVVKAWIWNNTYKGKPVTAVTVGSTSKDFIQLNRDYFLTPLPGYQPYTFPHPLTTGEERPLPPRNLRIVSSGN